MKYRTRDGDMIDQICATHYGTETGHSERVYAANPYHPFKYIPRAVTVSWSSCWYERNPWRLYDEIIPYVAVRTVLKGDLAAKAIFIGPLSIVAGYRAK